MGYKIVQTQIKRELVIWKPRFKEAMVEYFLNTRDNVLERSQNAQKNLKRKKKILQQIPLW